MDFRSSPVLLVSANVGSIFEDPEVLLKIWVKEFLQIVQRLQPKFFALHCQEVGGKDYKKSMKHVENFVRLLMASEELAQFDKVRIYLDEDFSSTEKFTALGNLYFIHYCLTDVLIWDFQEQKFIPVPGKEVHSGNIEQVQTKEKSKFPEELSPENKSSRKGFMRTRWSVQGAVFDLVNVHLFHDASNFVAIESFPSKYSENRRKALAYAMKRFATDEYENVPHFLFGDFNFRLDTKAVVQKLTSQTLPMYFKNNRNGEVEKIVYMDRANTNKVILTLEKKVFDLNNRHQEAFSKGGQWLREFDKEPAVYMDELFEFDITFPPSYPFEEDIHSKTSYMKTRCPSWCDRILLSKSSSSLIDMTPLENNVSPICYQLIGEYEAMGDHKPVMLLFRLLRKTDKKPCEFEDNAGMSKTTYDSLHLNLPRISVTLPTMSDTATFTRFIHVKQPGSPIRIFRETTV